MAAPSAQLTKTPNDYGSDVDLASVTALSDYGSEIGLDEIDEELILAGVRGTIKRAKEVDGGCVLPSIEFEEGEREDEHEDQHHGDSGCVQIHRPSLLRVAKDKDASARPIASSPPREHEALEVEYDERSRRAWSVPSSLPQPEKSILLTEAIHAKECDSRSPLERFRTKPKKPLSVTDLISPAWCELQYSYTLTKFGRKPRTQAMRSGTKIHQKLEDEVHTTVPVQVQTKEDRFGLRLWNAISGLRCLRETGLTRELEVWGILEGQVVNGVIDELSYTCPDTAFEEQTERAQVERNGGVVLLPPGQNTLTQDRLEPNRQVYIADVKTRSVRSVPAGASLRPTWMQLMLYRKLLESLSLNTVDAETIFARYDVTPLRSFTPTFLNEIGSIGSGNEATNFPNLLSLWALLITEMQVTLPPTSLSPILRAEFRYVKTGNVIGSELTVYKTNIIDGYIAEEMDWWKGRRDAKGVEIEEAFKCRICDFAENCTWRKSKVEDATEKSRLRNLGREKGAV